MPFHAEKGGIFIGPNGFKNGAKKCLILDFQDPGGTIAITGWYHRLTLDGTIAQSGRYHHLTELKD